MNRVLNAVRQVKPKDFLAPFVFLILLIPSLIFRLVNKIKRRKLWLVAEEGEARDNGYHFYKYVRENHPTDFCFYAINSKSPEYKKVRELGNIIKYGSLKHWLYYMSADLNISSQKSGNPTPIFWYIIHVKLRLYKNRVFLQHGITKDDSKWIYQNQTRFKYFICGVKREYDYILKKFGYKKDNLLLTGFSRWDSLKDLSKEQKNKSILIMPTWRNWLGGEKNKLFAVKDFLNTDYYKAWSEFLNDAQFIKFIEKNKIDVYFYPHINMQQFLESFKRKSKNIKLVLCEEDIQKYFNECDLMVTDYSSVAFDFAYLRKPTIYYQFDLEQYRKKQYQEGYFSYENDGFGPVVRTKDNLVKLITDILENGVKKNYEKRFDIFSEAKNFGNSERIYNSLRNFQLKASFIEDKKVSVIVPVYNAENYIERCVNSLIKQIYGNIEIVVIDDGSTDSSVDVVEKMQKNDARIKLIKQKHGGPNKARARGIKMASGDYIMFVDADDFIVDSAISVLVEKFKKNKVDSIRFNGIYFPTGKSFNCATNDNIIIGQRKVSELIGTTYKLNSLCLQIYKAELLKNGKIFKTNLVYGEDFLANLIISRNIKKMLLASEVLYCYCDNPNSTTRFLSRKHIIANLADRVYVSNEAIKNAVGSDIYDKIVFSQIKMVRNSILEVSRIENYTKEKFLKDIKPILAQDYFKNIDLDNLKKYMKKLGLKDKIKNQKIVLAILARDYDYIWRYVCIYKNVFGRIK